MSRKGRRIIILAAILAAIPLAGFAIYSYRAKDSLAILDDTSYRVVSRQEILGKPLIDIPWFGGERLRWPPKPSDVSADLKEMPTVAGVVYSDRELFGRVQWKVEGVLLESIEYSEFMGPEFETLAPFVFGTSSKLAEVIPYAGAAPIRMRLPANGVPAPKLPALDQRKGDWRLILTPIPLVSPRSPIVYEVRVEGPPSATFVTAQFKIEAKGDDPEGTMWERHHLVCHPVPGKLVLHDWRKQGTLAVRISAPKLRRETVDVIVKPSAARTNVWIRTRDGQQLIHRHYGSDGYGMEGGGSMIDFFHGPIALGFGDLGSIASIGSFGSLDSPSREQGYAFTKTLKNGQKLAVDIYEDAATGTEFRMPFTFPDPKQFEADRLSFEAEETEAQRKAWRGIRN